MGEAGRYRHPGALRLQLQAEVDAVAVIDATGVVADGPLVAAAGEDRRPVEAGPYVEGAVGGVERRDLENPLDRLVAGHAGVQIGNGATGGGGRSSVADYRLMARERVDVIDGLVMSSSVGEQSPSIYEPRGSWP